MKPSLSDQAYAALKKDIIACELDPGSQIAQSQLMERYELGLTPIREALKRLEQEGYVLSVPRFGYLVSPITLNYVTELFELRTILEVAAARLAAERASAEQLAELAQWADISYVYKDRSSYTAYLEMNKRFHVAVALAAGNRRLAETVDRVLDEMTRIFHIGIDVTDSAEDLRHDHLALVDALAAHDVEGAALVCRDQIERSRRLIIQNVHSRGKSPLAQSDGPPGSGLRELADELIYRGLRH